MRTKKIISKETKKRLEQAAYYKRLARRLNSPVDEIKELKYYLDDHCYYCGDNMVLLWKTKHNYNTDNGKPEYQYKIRCRNYTWWNPFSRHSDVDVVVTQPYKLLGSRKITRSVYELTSY